jgi:hypothetical protein
LQFRRRRRLGLMRRTAIQVSCHEAEGRVQIHNSQVTHYFGREERMRFLHQC